MEETTWNKLYIQIADGRGILCRPHFRPHSTFICVAVNCSFSSVLYDSLWHILCISVFAYRLV